MRSVFEIFGRNGIKDPEILKVAEAIGARVLTKDRGRQIGEGFGRSAIQVDARIERSVSDITRLLSESLK